MNYREILASTVQTLALFAAGLILPVFGQLFALLTPVPLVLVAVRSGMLQGCLVLLGSGVIVGFAAGWHAAAVLVFSFGIMAIGIAEGMRRQWKPESAVLLGGILPVLTVAVVTIVFIAETGKNPVLVLEEYLRETISEMAKIYSELGLSEMARIVLSVSDGFVHYLVRLLPGIVIATSVSQAAVCYAAARSLILKKPGAAPAIRSMALTQWHAPDIWVWGLIVALALIVFPPEIVQFTGWNLAIIYVVVYLTQGVAVVDYYLRKARFRPFLRVLLHTLILSLPSIVFVISLGIVDIWADFRKVREQKSADRSI